MIAKRKKPKFLRLGYTQYSKLGLRRKKKQIYRRANGIDNKVRLRMKGHLRNVSIGFRSEKSERGLVKGLEPFYAHNLEEIKKAPKDSIVILCKMGKRKKLEIAEYAVKNNIKIFNVNPKKFVETVKEEQSKLKEEKLKKQEKKKIKEKRAKESEEKKKEEKTESKEDKENKDEPKK